jgi:hypothetical protein
MVGIGIIFLRDGQKSANVVAVQSLDLLPADGIFARDFLTAVPMPAVTWKNYLAEKRFKSGVDSLNRGELNPRALSMTDLAEMDSLGVYAAKPVAPYSLIFRPTTAAQRLFRNASANEDFRSILKYKGENIELLSVYAQETKNGEEQYIGAIHTRSNFVSSIAGDEEIFIKHSMPHLLDEDLMPCPIVHYLGSLINS